jgi:hypothetical protein
MRRDPKLEQKWDMLMSLCSKEKEYSEQHKHPKVLRLVTDEIERLAGEMGFSPRQVKRREFRAEKVDGHIQKLIFEP